MRPRTPAILYLPFLFSVATISWALLIAGVALLAAVVLAPALRDVNTAQRAHNDYQATLQELDQKIALEKDFAKDATKDPLLMERLASRQLNINRPDQEILLPDPGPSDHSVQSLLDQSLHPVSPAPVPAMNPLLEYAASTGLRPFLIIFACSAITLSFLATIRFQRH